MAAPRNTVTQSLQAQTRHIPLVFTSGMDGYRSAFVAGLDFEVNAEFQTMEAAHAANRQAIATTANLMARLFPKASA